MKRLCLKFFGSLTVLMAFGLCAALPSLAFDTVTCCDNSATVYGWLRNNLGLFTELDQGDDLASNRSWARVYLDSKIGDNLSVWVAAQAVYEPEYEVENTLAEESHSEAIGDYHEYDRFEDVIREIYFDYSFNKSHSLRVGRQIVIWGESLTTRVGDVVHPEDQRFAFAFSNLEDTRIPQWIIKGTHDFAGMGSSVEWLVNPNWVDEEYRINRSYLDSQGRFGIPGGQPYDLSFLGMGTMNLPVLMAHDIFVNHYAPTGVVEEVLPDDNLDDLRYGFKTSTFLGGAEFGALFFHTQDYQPTFAGGAIHTIPNGIAPGIDLNLRDYQLLHPSIDIIGLYTNMDIPLGLLRAEAIYVPNKPFQNFTEADGWSRENYFKYMLAWDLNGYFYFDWHKSAPFDITVEHVGEIVPENSDLQFAFYDTQMPAWRPGVNFRISTNWFYNILATEIIAGYTWGDEDGSGLFMPVVKWTPSWNNDMFSAELRYIGLFGGSNYEDLGMFKDRDMVVLTTQINF